MKSVDRKTKDPEFNERILEFYDTILLPKASNPDFKEFLTKESEYNRVLIKKN